MFRRDRTTWPSARENSPWLEPYRDVFTERCRVLDLGCGTGDDALDLAEIGCQVIALDLDVDRVACVPSHPGIRLRIAADVTAGLPFALESFDHVVASLSLHYFDSPTTLAAFAEIASVLRREGALILRVNATGDVNFGYRAGEQVEPNLFQQSDGQLKRFFDPASLESFLVPEFEIDRIVARTILQHGTQKRTLESLARKV